MRIGIVTHAYYPCFGGVTEHVAGSAGALRDLGHEVHIFTAGLPRGHTGGNGELPAYDERRPLVRLGRQYLVSLHGATVNVTLGARLERRFERLFVEHRLDVVHVHSPVTPMLPMAAVDAAYELGLPVVGTFHAAAHYNLGYHVFRRTLQRRFARLTRRIAVSEPARTFVGRYFDGAVDIIPNGVDLTRFRPPEEPRSGRPTVAFVGRLDPRKGVEHLIAAMALVCERVPGARLLVVGDGPRRQHLERCASCAPAGAIVFTGAVPPAELPRQYQRADVVCAPATCNESFGIVLLEAMASGRPVVASDISGYRTLLRDGDHGRLVAPGDVEAMAAGLIELLEDDDARQRASLAARSFASQFGWMSICKQLEGVYEQAIEECAAGDQAGLPIAQPA